MPDGSAEGRVETEIGAEPEFATLPDLLQALGYDLGPNREVTTEFEDYVETHLDHDTSVWMEWDRPVDPEPAPEDGSGEHVTVGTDEGVNTQFNFPISLTKLHARIDELDCRIGRIRTLGHLPDVDDNDADPVLIAGVIGQLFGVAGERVVGDLGSAWGVVESDAVGTYSNPTAYLMWEGRAAIGIDPEYLHVFRIDPDGAVIDAYAGGVLWELEWVSDAAPDYEGFVSALRDLTPTQPINPSAREV